ncbi:hypothetical protein KCU81_g8049, partial [Aureobasidium melanogenum]|uniref:Concanavalin A-like lectin/glucanase n=1 Tax=Aureobasidium melanogenum (strain CBS 110374) TaxID=1043003 RepID=A0A074WCJ9_AURM1
MVRLTQLFWAISVATGAVRDRFGNKLQLRTYSSHIIEAETTVQLRNLPENKEGYAIIWTGVQDAANEVIVQGMASNVGFECSGTSEQWCVFATGNLGISFAEGQRQKFAPGFALTPGPSYKVRYKFDEKKGQIDLTLTSEDGALSTSTISMQRGKPTVWLMEELAVLSFNGEVSEHSFVNTTIVLAAPDAKFSATRPFDRGVSGEWSTTDDKTFTAPKLTVASFNFTGSG